MAHMSKQDYSIDHHSSHQPPDHYNKHSYNYKTSDIQNENHPPHLEVHEKKISDCKEALWKADWYSRRNYEDAHHYYSDGNDDDYGPDDDKCVLGSRTGEFSQLFVGNYDDTIQPEVIKQINHFNQINRINQNNGIHHVSLVNQPRLVKEEQIKQSRASNHRTNLPSSAKPPSVNSTSSAGSSCTIKLNVNYINHKLVANHAPSAAKLTSNHASTSTNKMAPNHASSTTKLVGNQTSSTKASPNHASGTVKSVTNHSSTTRLGANPTSGPMLSTSDGVIKKKKDQEPTSPQITCLGRVRNKKRIKKPKNPLCTSGNDAISSGSTINPATISGNQKDDDKSECGESANVVLRRIRKKPVSYNKADDLLSTKMDLCIVKGGLIKEISGNQTSVKLDGSKAPGRWTWNSASKLAEHATPETKSRAGFFSQLYRDRGQGIKAQDQNQLSHAKISSDAAHDNIIADDSFANSWAKYHLDQHNIHVDQSDSNVIIDLSRFGSTKDQIWAQSVLTGCLIHEPNLINNVKPQTNHGRESVTDSEQYDLGSQPPKNSLLLMRNSRNTSSDNYFSLITSTSTRPSIDCDPSKSTPLHDPRPQSANTTTAIKLTGIINYRPTIMPLHDHSTTSSLWERRRIPQPSAIDIVR